MSLRSKHNEATALVQQMTVEEKASLCSGKSTWYLQGVERLGLEPVMVTDGPHGLQVGVDLRCVAGTARWAVVLR